MYSQEQSPLFRLPRELRDEIYAYVAYEVDGYRHIFQTACPGRLRLANGGDIDISLAAACKKVALEIRGISLRTNTIHFFPGDTPTDAPIQSLALRFQRLNYYVDVTNWRMLRLAAECIDDRILEEVEREFVDNRFRILFKRHTSERGNLPMGSTFDDWYEMQGATDYSVHRALQYCLKLASTHPLFHERAAAACTSSPARDSFQPGVTFVPGSHMAVLQWNPKSWCIPIDSQLEPMESLLAKPEDATAFLERNHHEWISWKFSACAVAIDALQRLPERFFTSLNSIVLHEESLSICAPETHTQGLAPLREELPQIHIERRVKGYSVAQISRWAPVTKSRLFRGKGSQALCFFEAVIPWLQEVQKGEEMDASHRGAFSLVFEDDNDEAMWARLVIAVRMQTDMQEHFRIRNIALPPVSTDERYIQMTFPLPWHFPDWLPKIMKSLILGTAKSIHYEGSLDPVSSDDAYDSPADGGNTPEDWRDSWEKLILENLAAGQDVH